MGSVFRLSRTQLEALIHDRAANGAQVVFTRHAQLRMKERRIVHGEVLEVLRRGRIDRPPEPNAAKGALECRMQRFVAGRELGVVAALSDEMPDVVVVTALVIGT
jgi:hypothetical protein